MSKRPSFIVRPGKAVSSSGRESRPGRRAPRARIARQGIGPPGSGAENPAYRWSARGEARGARQYCGRLKTAQHLDQQILCREALGESLVATRHTNLSTIHSPTAIPVTESILRIALADIGFAITRGAGRASRTIQIGLGRGDTGSIGQGCILLTGYTLLSGAVLSRRSAHLEHLQTLIQALFPRGILGWDVVVGRTIDRSTGNHRDPKSHDRTESRQHRKIDVHLGRHCTLSSKQVHKRNSQAISRESENPMKSASDWKSHSVDFMRKSGLVDKALSKLKLSCLSGVSVKNGIQDRTSSWRMQSR